MNQLVQKSLLIFTIFALTIISSPYHTVAQNSNSFITTSNVEAEIVPRYPHGDAEYYITTQEKSVDLLLTNSEILFQFTDDYLDKIATEIQSENDLEDSTHFAAVLRSALSSGIQKLLDRAISIPLNEIGEIYYENSRLVMINRDGEEMFEDTDIDGVNIMEDFSRRDATRFIAEAEKRMI
jgi:hypothetical protein